MLNFDISNIKGVLVPEGTFAGFTCACTYEPISNL